MSVPSIDPKTVAIGAAVVVAGIGAYMLLSAPAPTDGEGGQTPGNAALCHGLGAGGYIACKLADPLLNAAGVTKEATQLLAEWAEDRKKAFADGQDALTKGDFHRAVKDALIIFHANAAADAVRAEFVIGTPPVDPLAGNTLFQQLTTQISTIGNIAIQTDIASARGYLAAGNVDLALSLAQSARDKIDVISELVGSFVQSNTSPLDDLVNAIDAATYKRDSQAIAKAAQPGGTAKAKLDAGLQAASDGGKLMSASGGDANNDKYRQQYGSAALKSQSGAVIQQAADDEEQAYRTLILRGLNLPADQYIALAEPYIIKWGQATYDEKVGNRYTQYYGPYHTYQDKKNSTNPHDLDDAMTALNQLPDWLVGSAERTSFSERRGQAALTAAHISQEDAEKQLSAIFGNLGSAASKLGTVFVKK